jgi:hypothetical protein
MHRTKVVGLLLAGAVLGSVVTKAIIEQDANPLFSAYHTGPSSDADGWHYTVTYEYLGNGTVTVSKAYVNHSDTKQTTLIQHPQMSWKDTNDIEFYSREYPNKLTIVLSDGRQFVYAVR